MVIHNPRIILFLNYYLFFLSKEEEYRVPAETISSETVLGFICEEFRIIFRYLFSIS
jgi:hypothetical protein